MGFIYDIKYKYSRQSAENLFPNTLAERQVCALIACPYTLAKMVDPSRHFGTLQSSLRRLANFS